MKKASEKLEVLLQMGFHYYCDDVFGAEGWARTNRWKVSRLVQPWPLATGLKIKTPVQASLQVPQGRRHGANMGKRICWFESFNSWRSGDKFLVPLFQESNPKPLTPSASPRSLSPQQNPTISLQPPPPALQTHHPKTTSNPPKNPTKRLRNGPSNPAHTSTWFSNLTPLFLHPR